MYVPFGSHNYKYLHFPILSSWNDKPLYSKREILSVYGFKKKYFSVFKYLRIFVLKII